MSNVWHVKCKICQMYGMSNEWLVKFMESCVLGRNVIYMKCTIYRIPYVCDIKCTKYHIYIMLNVMHAKCMARRLYGMSNIWHVICIECCMHGMSHV